MPPFSIGEKGFLLSRGYEISTIRRKGQMHFLFANVYTDVYNCIQKGG